MIDLHCHILPGLDDGPASLEESLAMASAAVASGIDTVVATPHTLNSVYTNHIDRIEEQAGELRQALDEREIPLMVHAAAEVHFDPELMDRVGSGEAATINKGRYLLLELPAHNLPPRLEETIFSLQLAGLTPVLAHPERNLIFQHNLEKLVQLIQMGALCQVTAHSVIGRFGSEIENHTATMLRSGLVHVIASDSHGPSFRRPDLRAAVDRAGSILDNHALAMGMVTTTPEKIIAGEPLEPSEPRLEETKKRWFWPF